MLLAHESQSLSRSPQQRLAIIAAVVGIHIAVIAAFLSGLAQHIIPAPIPGPLIVDVIPSNSHTLPPPPPTDYKFERPIVPDPQFPTGSDNAIHAVDPGPVSSGPANPPVRFIAAQPLMGTHTTPDYPPLDTRLGHEGNVLLKLSIDQWGAVVDAQVEHSSGYESLDRAAANWVKSHWLYRPATRAGDAVPSTAEVTVTFRLTMR